MASKKTQKIVTTEFKINGGKVIKQTEKLVTKEQAHKIMYGK